MTKHVIEMVKFRAKNGVAPEDMRKAAEEANAFIRSQPGFVRRRLSLSEDGTWIEHIEWESMDDAQCAAKAIGKDEHTQAFMRAIDGSSVKMSHSRVEIALG